MLFNKTFWWKMKTKWLITIENKKQKPEKQNEWFKYGTRERERKKWLMVKLNQQWKSLFLDKKTHTITSSSSDGNEKKDAESKARK